MFIVVPQEDGNFSIFTQVENETMEVADIGAAGLGSIVSAIHDTGHSAIDVLDGGPIDPERASNPEFARSIQASLSRLRGTHIDPEEQGTPLDPTNIGTATRTPSDVA
jgi:hypothetical protein